MWANVVNPNYNRKFKGILIVYILVSVAVHLAGQNLALNKSYTMSAIPNYAFSAKPNDKSSLTDGIYTSGYFWTKPTTVGWLSQPVTITIDLGKIEIVEDVTFNTARGIGAGVNYPQNIFIFTSIDNENLRYIGDAGNSKDNLPGDYLVHKFVLPKINQSARYITLSIVPKGVLIFCDEIEVHKGNVDSKDKNNLIKRSKFNTTLDSIKLQDNNVKYLLSVLENLQNNSTADKYKTTSKLWQVQKDHNLAKLTTQLNVNDNSKISISSVKNQIGKVHASELRNKFDKHFVLEHYSAWDSMNEYRTPESNSEILNFSFLIPKDGVRYGSFIITNCDSTISTLTFNVSNENNSLTNLELFDVPWVYSSNNSRTPDPLIEVNKKISILPGSTEMFIFKIIGSKSGSEKSKIKIQSGNNKAEVNIDATTVNISTNLNENNLNANVWAYLNYPMLKNCKKEAINDLISHHVNTIVIPPAVIPNIKSTNNQSLIDYIDNIKNAKNVLLFLNYSSESNRNGYQNGQFMSQDWKKLFVLWYNDIIQTIHSHGLAKAEIYLYPFDEVGNENIDNFVAFTKWVKIAIPGVKIFATLVTKSSIDALCPLIDISQISTSFNGIKELQQKKCKIWTYNTTSSARTLSPYFYYRMMAWEAFARDFEGIGFWNYADEGDSRSFNSIDEPLIDASKNYSVIYNGPNNEIISSRRWEAFRMGIEDYSILQQYAQSSGKNKALTLARQVLNNPTNCYKADSIINIIMTQLKVQ